MSYVAPPRKAQTDQPPGPPPALASLWKTVVIGGGACGVLTLLKARHSPLQCVRVNVSAP